MSIERRLPESLAILRELANDLHWSWSHDSDQLWLRLNREIWESTHNPVSVLHFTSDQTGAGR
jgi:starch phosphorylase